MVWYMIENDQLYLHLSLKPQTRQIKPVYHKVNKVFCIVLCLSGMVIKPPPFDVVIGLTWLIMSLKK